MAPGVRRVKRESLGLPTPDASLYDASADTIQGSSAQGSSQHQDGLPIVDEEYASRVAEETQDQIRPASVSIRGSRLQPPHQTPAQVATDMEPTPTQGFELVGSKVKLLVDAISDLRQIGLEHVAPLPTLVLVGDQSHGKSSLMSALTEVQLPRGMGVCTRCPANIKTSPADVWSCKVTLQQEFRYENPRGRPITERSVTKNQPFPPWVEQSLEVKDFVTISNKSDLEEAVKWAQIALLNHNQDHNLFIPGKGRRAQNFEQEHENTTAKFSPNLIGLEINGPGLPALSFYDLPGVFVKTERDEDQYLAKVIRNLARTYIARPNALIIWTLSMRSDPSNAQTGKLIHDCKASQRCIGVLTNPDHVAARHIEYERMLQGNAHIVGHGYFVTKQPGEDSQLQGPTYHLQAREEELKYFDQDNLWTGIWSDFRPRCGTRAVQEYLSQELARQIATILPEIRTKISNRSEYVDQQLKECPALPESDVRNTVMKHLASFSSDVRYVLAGNTLELSTQPAKIPNFNISWTTLAGQFRNLILHIKPRVSLNHGSDIPRSGPIVIDLMSDDDDSVVSTPSSSLKRAAESPSGQQRQRPKLIHTPQFQPPIEFKAENGLAMQPPSAPNTPNRGGAGGQKNNPFLSTPFKDLHRLGNGFIDLDGIRRTIQKYNSAGLPGLVDPKTHNELCLDAVNPWKRVLDVFTENTYSLVRNQLEDLLKKHLGGAGYEQTALYASANRFLDEFSDKFEVEQSTWLLQLYQLETYKSFTINDPQIVAQCDKELEELRTARKKSRARAVYHYQLRTDPKKRLAPEATKEERDKHLEFHVSKILREDNLGPDQFDNELRVAAYVRGYYVTAAYRFVDSVCLSIQGKFFRELRENISIYLEDKLGIMGEKGEEICRNLMEENPGMFEKRRNLQNEKRKLEDFSERLAQLVEDLELPNMDIDTPNTSQDGSCTLNGYHQQTIYSDDEDEDMTGADDTNQVS